MYELAKKDASIASFFTIHNLGQYVVNSLGDEEQKQRILTDTIKMDKILSFALTESEYGSDATSLKTTATKVSGGYSINGVKRWIGNATFSDYIIVWAKN